MKLLAIDTATEACSAALLLGDDLRSRYSEPKRGHAELILPMVDELLREAGVTLNALDCIAVGRGPGAFTGVRIAMSIAQGLAFGAGLPVVPVSTLATLAQGAQRLHGAGGVLACIDARMAEVYWGAYRATGDGRMQLCGEEHVSPPAAIDLKWNGCTRPDHWLAVGTGWGAYPELIAIKDESGNRAMHIEPTLLPHAQDIARLAVHEFKDGRAVSPELALPVYLRDQVAKPPAR